MAKPKKVVSEDTTTTTRGLKTCFVALDEYNDLDSLAIVEARLKKLETFAADLMKGLHWAATRLKSTWGLSTVGAVLDELSKKLDK